MKSPLIPATSAADGTLSLALLVGENTQLRIRSAGSWDRLEGLSPVVTISVARTISWNPPTSIRSGVTYLITGQIQPAVAGVTVQLDDGVAAHSATWSSAKTLADGTFTLTLSASQIGVHSYRVIVPADLAFIASQTEFVKVLVR